mgnify:CR=1 FL=1
MCIKFFKIYIRYIFILYIWIMYFTSSCIFILELAGKSFDMFEGQRLVLFIMNILFYRSNWSPLKLSNNSIVRLAIPKQSTPSPCCSSKNQPVFHLLINWHCVESFYCSSILNGSGPFNVTLCINIFLGSYEGQRLGLYLFSYISIHLSFLSLNR